MFYHKRNRLVVGLGILIMGIFFLCSGCGKKGMNVLVESSDKREFTDAVKECQDGYRPSMEFINKKIGDDDVVKLVELSEDKLLHLGLAFTEITNASMETIAKIPGLRDLDLAGVHINNEGLKPFTNHPTLERIVLNETAITDTGLEIVATIPNLKCLEVYRCFITDTGLKSIGKMSNLETISLDCTRITDKGLPFLYTLTELKRLQVRDTGVSKEGRKTLQEKMPKVTIAL